MSARVLQGVRYGARYVVLSVMSKSTELGWGACMGI